MINSLHIKNFKGFKEINADFTQTAKKTKPLVFVYGENGVGKTNLIKAVDFILKTTRTLTISKALQSRPQPSNADVYAYNQFLANSMDSNIPNLIMENKRIGSVGKEMLLSIEFTYNGSSPYFYEIGFNDKGINKEILKIEKNEKLGYVYSITNNPSQDKIDCQFMFNNKGLEKDVLYNLNKFRGQHSLLSILTLIIGTSNKDFVINSFNKKLLEFIHALRSIIIIENSLSLSASSMFYQSNKMAWVTGFVRSIDYAESKIGLKKSSEELSLFYSSLYSSVIDAKYKFTPMGDTYRYDLYFLEKDSDGKLIELPFTMLSKGTQKLLDTFIALKHILQGDTVLIDEIDSGVHDLMMKDVLLDLVRYVSENDTNGQMIITTHNTLIMKELKPADLYILDRDKDENKELYPLSDFGKNIQATNNITKKYLSGLFGGIPYTNLSIETLAELCKKHG